ncbi:MAG: calcium/proton exchanger [Dehalococcoidia bacterium]|nr:calcium/proton exchanger [Dehalococcoidia bacterium]
MLRNTWFLPGSLLILAPLSIALNTLDIAPVAVFIVTLLSLIPISSLVSRSTQELSLRTATVVGSLLNATFGNIIELMIAIFAINQGLQEMVMASLAGSIILNILLLIGVSMIAGGLKHRDQTFNTSSVGVSSTMLLIAVAGLALPTIYAELAEPTVHTEHSVILMSRAVSITLGVTYLLSLVFVLFTHRHLFVSQREASEPATWSTAKAAMILGLSVGLAAIESNILVGVIQPIIDTTHLHQAFVGLVVIAVITNIPEHMAAIQFGLRDNITLSLEIGMNSAIQIALFVVPILVLISPLLGTSMSLAFPPFLIVGMILSVMIINYIGSDGICNWLEGVQLVAVYAIIAIAFYFV